MIIRSGKLTAVSLGVCQLLEVGQAEVSFSRRACAAVSVIQIDFRELDWPYGIGRVFEGQWHVKLPQLSSI